MAAVKIGLLEGSFEMRRRDSMEIESYLTE